jgi:hypothetical protein
MKNFFALLTIVLFIFFVSACNVQAQFATKKVIELGGSVSYSSTTMVTDGTSAGESTSLFQFMPYANYYIIDGVSLGISPGINVLKMAGSSESITNYSIFFVPGYTYSTRSNVFPFIEGMIGYTSLSQDTTLDLSGISFGAKGGVKLVLGKSGVVSIGLSYILYNLSPKDADKRSGYNNFAFSLGYSIYLN